LWVVNKKIYLNEIKKPPDQFVCAKNYRGASLVIEAVGKTIGFGLLYQSYSMGKLGTQAKTYSSIIKTTGTQNTAIGYTTGTHNTAIGKPVNCSGYYKTTGIQNTAVGQKKPPLEFAGASYYSGYVRVYHH